MAASSKSQTQGNTANGKHAHTSRRGRRTLGLLLTGWPGICLLTLLILALGFVSWRIMNPPIQRVMIFAGPKGQAYERAGMALEEALQATGLFECVHRSSDPAGSLANAHKLLLSNAEDSCEENSQSSAESGKKKRFDAYLAIVQQPEIVSYGAHHEKADEEVLAVLPLFTARVIVAIRKDLLDGADDDDVNFDDLAPTDSRYQRIVAKVLREQLQDMQGVDRLKPGSGTYLAAEKLHAHYCSANKPKAAQAPNESDANLSEVDKQANHDAADDDNLTPTSSTATDTKVFIRQTAWLDENLITALRDDTFELVSIDAGALAQQAEYHEVVIPTGAYGFDANDAPIPHEDINTVGSTDFIVVRGDAPESLVIAILDAVYGNPHDFEEKLNQNPSADLTRPPIHLISHADVLQGYLNSSFHPAAQAYFQPFDPSELATWTEFLAGSKDLLVALAAGVFLLYGLRVRAERRAEEQRVREEKEVLDSYLRQTIRLEGEQWNCRDPDRLEKILAEVTAIKIEALDKLSHEDLRSDRAFSIFLMQCANVINKIQMKILAYRKNP